MAHHESELSITTDGGNGELVPVGQVSIPRSLEPALKPYLQIIDGEIYIPLYVAEMLVSVRHETEERTARPTSPDGCDHWSNSHTKTGIPKGPGRYSNNGDRR